MKWFKSKFDDMSKNTFISTFTKTWLNRLLWFSVLWVSAPYILGFIGINKAVISSLVTLSKVVLSALIPIMLGYFCKSYFETKEQKKNELKEKGIE